VSETLTILSIICGSLSVLVGFLLLFLQFYPQRKRTLLQNLQVQKICTKDGKIKKKINDAIEKLKEPDEIVLKINVNSLNFKVFVYVVVIFILSLMSILSYIYKGGIPDILIILLLVLTIVGYLLLIPVAKYSYIARRKILIEDNEDS